MCAGQLVILWVKEAKYLGIHISSGSKFKCSFSKSKVKYYRAANAILAKLGNKENTSVILNLLASIVSPVLTYSIEALVLNKSDLLSLNHPWERSSQNFFAYVILRSLNTANGIMGFYP